MQNLPHSPVRLLRHHVQGSRRSALLQGFDSFLWGSARFVYWRTSVQEQPLYVLLYCLTNDLAYSLLQTRLTREDVCTTLSSQLQLTPEQRQLQPGFCESPISDEELRCVLSALKDS